MQSGKIAQNKRYRNAGKRKRESCRSSRKSELDSSTGKNVLSRSSASNYSIIALRNRWRSDSFDPMMNILEA